MNANSDRILNGDLVNESVIYICLSVNNSVSLPCENIDCYQIEDFKRYNSSKIA